MVFPLKPLFSYGKPQYPSMPHLASTLGTSNSLCCTGQNGAAARIMGGNGAMSFAQNGDMMWMMYVNIYIYNYIYYDNCSNIYIYITIIVIHMVPPGVQQPPSQCYPPSPHQQSPPWGWPAVYHHPSRSHMLYLHAGLVPPMHYITGWLDAVFTTACNVPIQSIYNVFLPIKYLHSSHIILSRSQVLYIRASHILPIYYHTIYMTPL